MKKIAIIGAGNMGSAVAASLCGSDYEVCCTAASQATLDRLTASLPGVKTTLSNIEAATDADIVVLAVKPYMAASVCKEICRGLGDGVVIISLIAGLSINELSVLLYDEDYYYLNYNHKSLRIARVIPNTAIRYGKSATFIAFGQEVPSETKEEVTSIFNRSGKAFVVAEEKIAACTSLASCGIAYFLRFIRAAVEGSVELGLKADFATEVAALTAEGAAALLSEGSHPEVEIDKVTTPGGLTIRGLNALEEHGLTSAVVAALRASTTGL